ncbi:hypothetical protein C5S35_12285 [Candidatus Methanophagaceae archaeon]|nr:hypothetical protein C5S35_12285 [Methanophagales archaeon]
MNDLRRKRNMNGKKNSYYPGKERRKNWLANLVNDFDKDVGDGRGMIR